MNKFTLYWICQIGGWSTYAIFNIFARITIEEEANNVLFFPIFLETAFLIFITHMYRNYIVRNNWLRLPMPKLIPRVILFITILSIICALLMTVLSAFSSPESIELAQSMIKFFGEFLGFIIVFLVWNLIYFLYHYVENYSTTLKFEATINEIKLNKLKSQLNPHFIFNALNSIRALVDENPKKSKVAITQLSNILRNSLVMDEKRLIKFSEEMQTVKDYLDLEGIRFEERLQVEFDVDPESDKFEIPPLMIQTLVENGIKHGISNLVEGGLIKVSTQVKDSCLNIQIKNSGQYLNGVVMKHGGYGIENTRQRLKLLFGERASFSIFNENENFVLTDVIIPKMK
ncbi:histidine kinase [Fulvivirgaceae bacterium BMA10]|uniref:Histidine kinase n=1 Tax=Splendidivirga corallicola TaxID=3051826 RepID=A0ABT8KTC5_9BACT|nr:histidine kinase [Fulvivirgaceae bacterium BMA10]